MIDVNDSLDEFQWRGNFLNKTDVKEFLIRKMFSNKGKCDIQLVDVEWVGKGC